LATLFHLPSAQNNGWRNGEGAHGTGDLCGTNFKLRPNQTLHNRGLRDRESPRYKIAGSGAVHVGDRLVVLCTSLTRRSCAHPPTVRPPT
jgi:hypothetical protein